MDRKKIHSIEKTRGGVVIKVNETLTPKQEQRIVKQEADKLVADKLKNLFNRK